MRTIFLNLCVLLLQRQPAWSNHLKFLLLINRRKRGWILVHIPLVCFFSAMKQLVRLTLEECSARGTALGWQAKVIADL